jgi:hypothetical protein
MILTGDVVPGPKPSRLDIGDSLVLSNLEGPVLQHTHAVTALPKAGPSLFSVHLPDTPAEMAFALANNHTMDYGGDGLRATLEVLKARSWHTVGAGRDVSEARAPLILMEDGTRWGVISCCEAQFGVATPNCAGVAEIGPWVYQAIRQLRKSVDVVIVSVHAALELSPWPSPRLQERYHSFIDDGAQVVHGHHAHVPQGWEKYGNGLILYGMGNLVVNPERWRSIPHSLWSVVADVAWRNGQVECQIVTCTIREEDGVIVVSPSDPQQRRAHNEYLHLCNAPLGVPSRLKALYQEVALHLFYEHYAGYLNLAFKPARIRDWREWARRIKMLLMYGREGCGRPQQLLWHVLFACLSHREAIAEALGVLAGEIPDLRDDETRQLVKQMMT